MSSDEGWEEVYKDDLNIQITVKEKLKRLTIKYNTFKSLLKIFKNFFEEVNIPKIDEFLDFNIINKMYQILRSDDKDKNSEYFFTNFIKNIKYFKFLTEHKIISRIYFIIDNDHIESFLEIYVNNIIIENKTKYKGCIFYIDTNNHIEDCSIHFSTNLKNHAIFNEVLNSFKNVFSMNEKVREFDNLDLRRNKDVPTSVIKFKKHPLYCLESTLRENQILGKKSIQGFFKGEPIFLKADLINLKSEKYWYRHGKIPIKRNDIPIVPSKIYKDVNFYSEDQVVDFVILDLVQIDSNYKGSQDFLHKNHIPVNCVYLKNDYDEFVCKKLKIDYRKCFIGFNRQNPVYKGVFIYKKDLFIVSNFIFEYFDYNIKQDFRNKALQIIHNWERLVKMCRKYEDLKSRIE